MRILWITIGLISLALGVIGIALPLLPTVPFLILSAFCFARSSQRLHDWLMDHPKFGPPVHDWNERGAIGRRVKYISSVSILAAFGLSFLFNVPAKIIAIQAVCLIGVAIFIWTRPD